MAVLCHCGKLILLDNCHAISYHHCVRVSIIKLEPHPLWQLIQHAMFLQFVVQEAAVYAFGIKAEIRLDL